MTFNRAEQTQENRLVNEIKELRRQLEEIKTAQPIGADVLTVEAVPSGDPVFVGPITLPAGSRLNISVTNTPLVSKLTIWNFLSTFYVDGSTAADRWPNGSNITGGKLSMAPVFWLDWEESDDGTGVRDFKATIQNRDSSSHDVYFRFKAYIPSSQVSIS